VRIAAAHSSDPQDVQDALMAAAHRCAGSLKEPEPEVAFSNVGENGLEFSVSVAMEDGADAKRVETALRTLVVKTLRDRGIGIANPQRDVHLRDLEGLRTFLARLAEERAQRAGADAKMQADRKPHGD
jgi:small-conductance mechanosensitive channel